MLKYIQKSSSIAVSVEGLTCKRKCLMKPKESGHSPAASILLVLLAIPSFCSIPVGEKLVVWQICVTR